MTDNSDPLITVLIVNWRSGAMTRGLVENARRQRLPGHELGQGIDFVVVDNASGDGSAEALAGLVQDHPRTELLGGGPAGSLPWGLLPGLDPIEGKALCQTETFAPVLIEVALDGSSPATFVEEAVRYCNQDVDGTLGVTLAVHPASMLDPATAAAVRHGTQIECLVEIGVVIDVDRENGD